MAATPAEVTHAFSLNDQMLCAKILVAADDTGAIKVVENRDFRMTPGWYGVAVTAGAYCSVNEEVTLRKEFPQLPPYMAVDRGKVHGLCKIGHSLPASMVKDVPGVEPRYKVVNVITEFLPFTRFPANGARARGNFGCWPLKDAEHAVRELAKSAELAGLRRTNHVEDGPLQDIEGIWNKISVGGKLLEDGKGGKGKKRGKAKEEATPAPQNTKKQKAKPEKGAMAEQEKTPVILKGGSLDGWVCRPSK